MEKNSDMDNDLLKFRIPPLFIVFALPKTNMAPENNPLEKEIPIGNHHFWDLC